MSSYVYHRLFAFVLSKRLFDVRLHWNDVINWPWISFVLVDIVVIQLDVYVFQFFTSMFIKFELYVNKIFLCKILSFFMNKCMLFRVVHVFKAHCVCFYNYAVLLSPCSNTYYVSLFYIQHFDSVFILRHEFITRTK